MRNAKRCGKLFAAALALGLMLSTTAYAQESVVVTNNTESNAAENEKNTEDVVIHLDGPESVYYGSERVVTVTVETAEDTTGWYIQTSESFLQVNTEKIPLSEGKAEITICCWTFDEYEDLVISVYDANGENRGSAVYTAYCIEALPVSLEWEEPVTVYVGQVYPFELKMKNNTDTVMKSVLVQTQTYGEAEITLDGNVMQSLEIVNLEPGETRTVSGTLVYKKAAEVECLNIDFIVDGGEYLADTGSLHTYSVIEKQNDSTVNENGNQTEDPVVEKQEPVPSDTAGDEQKPVKTEAGKAPKTGDEAPVTGMVVLALGAAAVCGITLRNQKKRQTR